MQCVSFVMCVIVAQAIIVAQGEELVSNKLNDIKTLDDILVNPPSFKLVDVLERVQDAVKTPVVVDASKTPVVVMHGMGDAGSNPGLASLCSQIQEYHKTYVVCLDVADSLSSITTKMEDQLTELVAVISKDDKLNNGFHFIGISQGALLARAYVVRHNEKPVKKLISWTGVQNGIATCPPIYKSLYLCTVFEKWLDPYNTPLVFSDYWKDSTDEERYLKDSRFLADVNNERAEKKIKYADNMKALEQYVLIEALGDHMIYPHESESHGFYAWGAEKALQKMEATEAYKGDWLGLKSLDKEGKILRLSYQGEHVQVPEEMWQKQILPLLGSASVVTEEIYV